MSLKPKFTFFIAAVRVEISVGVVPQRYMDAI